MTKKLLLKNRYLLILVIASSMHFLTACGDKKSQSVPPVPAPAKPAVTAVAPAKPVQKQNSSVVRLPAPPANTFDFSNKKDPFKPFIVVKTEPKATSGTSKKIQRDSLPIHSFDISQFKLIGIITGSRENKAMVVDPGGKGYVLKVGMLIGKNDGKVTSITESGVSILEQFRDDNGRVRKENIKLTLPRKQ